MQRLGLVAVFLGVCTFSVGEIVVETSSPLLQVGDDVTIRCRVSDFNNGKLLFWWKKQADQETQMGTNRFPNEVFSSTNRYTMNHQNDAEGEDIFLLNIQNVQAEDSGEIGCSLRDESGLEPNKQYTRIDVVTSPTSIRLFALRSNETDAEAIEEYTDGQQVSFNQGDEYFFRCAAGGSSYPPSFAIALGDRDLTEQFTSQAEYEVSDGQPGLKKLIYSGEATTHEPVVISIEENALQFSCTAAVPGWETTPQVITITPVLKFAPIVECPKRVVKELYEKYVDDIKCTIKAEPPLEELYWTYEQEVEGKPELTAKKTQKFKYTFKLLEGEEYIHYSHRVEEGETPDEKESTLFIERASPNTFRKYTIYARNELGEVSKSVPFVLENPGALQAASSIYISSLLIAMFAAIAYFFQM